MHGGASSYAPWPLALLALAAIHQRWTGSSDLSIARFSFLLLVLPYGLEVACELVRLWLQKNSPATRHTAALRSSFRNGALQSGSSPSHGKEDSGTAHMQTAITDRPWLTPGTHNALLCTAPKTPMQSSRGISSVRNPDSFVQTDDISGSSVVHGGASCEPLIMSLLPTAKWPLQTSTSGSSVTCFIDADDFEADAPYLQLSQLLPSSCYTGLSCASQQAQQAHMYGCMGSVSDSENSGGGHRTHVLSIKVPLRQDTPECLPCAAAVHSVAAAAAAALAQENRPHMRLLPVSTLCVEDDATHLLMVVRPLTDSAVFEDQDDSAASFIGSGPSGASPLRHMDLCRLVISDPDIRFTDSDEPASDDVSVRAAVKALLKRCSHTRETSDACRVQIVQQAQLAVTWPPCMEVGTGAAAADSSGSSDMLNLVEGAVAVLVPRALLRGLSAVRCVVGGPMGRVLADEELQVDAAVCASTSCSVRSQITPEYYALRLALPVCTLQRTAALVVHLLPPLDPSDLQGSAPMASVALLVLPPAAAAEVRQLFQDMLGATAVTVYGQVSQLSVAEATPAGQGGLSGSGWSSWGEHLCHALALTAAAHPANDGSSLRWAAEPVELSPSAAACLQPASASMYSFSFDFGALLQLPQGVQAAPRERGCSPAAAPDVASSFLPLLRFLASRRMVACLREGLAALAEAGVALGFGEWNMLPDDHMRTGQAAIEGFTAALSQATPAVEAQAVAGATTEANIGPGAGSIAEELAAAEAEVAAAAAFEAALDRDESELLLLLSSRRGTAALAAAASMPAAAQAIDATAERRSSAPASTQGLVDEGGDAGCAKSCGSSQPVQTAPAQYDASLPDRPGLRWWLRSLLLGFWHPGIEEAYQRARAGQCSGLDYTGLLARFLILLTGSVRATRDAWAVDAVPEAASDARVAAATAFCAAAVLLAACLMQLNNRSRPLLLMLGFALENLLAGAACLPNSWARSRSATGWLGSSGRRQMCGCLQLGSTACTLHGTASCRLS